MIPTEPALVIGGGVAGSAVAAEIARAGRRVALIERRQGPHHKVCGEFISEEAELYLRELGIDLVALGAFPIAQVRLCAGRQAVARPLPFRAFGLSRFTLDEALLRRASDLGADLLRGRGVRELQRNGERWTAKLDGGARASARDVFLASGKHDLRGWKRPPGRQADLIGFKLHWRLAARQAAELGTSVELFIFPDGYAGLAPVENGTANLCLLVRRRRFVALGLKWDALLAALLADCPKLAQRLAHAEPCRPRPLAIASIPYGFVQMRPDGLWRLGDQAACIPSFCGDGISIALHSARLAARSYLEGGDAAGFQTRLAQDIAAQVGRAMLISRALIHPAGQKIGKEAAKLLPDLLAIAAKMTRVPAERIKAAMEPTA